VPRLLALERYLASLARSERPHVAVLIDFPDFHLRLARCIADAGIPVVQYGGPSIWAWRRRRAVAFGRAFRRILLLFPFELPAWREAGVDAVVVGHPLVDRRASPADAERPPRFVLIPGSRAAERARHLPVLLAAAQRLARRGAEARFDVASAPGYDPDHVAQRIAAFGLGDRAQVVSGIDPDRIRGATGAIVAAGTASLEVALCGVPSLVVHRMDPLSFAVLRRLVRVPSIALPNLILERRAVSERLQRDVRADALAAWMGSADDPRLRRRARADAAELERRLGPAGASDRAAEAVLEISRSRPRGRSR